jgi:hypothetical protein
MMPRANGCGTQHNCTHFGVSEFALLCLQKRFMRLCSQILAPPHDLQLLLLRVCSQMLAPPQGLQRLLLRLCSQMLDTPHACTRFFGGCARRCSPRRIACTCFLCGCARRCLIGPDFPSIEDYRDLTVRQRISDRCVPAYTSGPH